jgi:hypothetical protein
MSNVTFSAILWVLAAVILLLYMMRRNRRKARY